MRQQLGKNYDPVVFENPEVRYSMLEQIIGQRLLDEQARKNRFRVSDDQLRQYISEIPAFQVDGKFSQQRYEQLLAAQSPPKTSQAFVNDVRQALMLAPLQEPISAGNIVAKSNVERYLNLLDQQREVATFVIAPDAYMKEVKVDDAAVAAFYDANKAAFQVPEQAKIEYVVLTPDALAGQVTVDARRRQEAIRRQPEAVRESGRASGESHPDRRQAGRQRCREGRGQGEGGGAGSAGEKESGAVRGAGQAEFAGSRVRGAGRRARFVSRATVRWSSRSRTRSSRRKPATSSARCRPTSAGTSSSSPAIKPGKVAKLRRGQGRDREGPEAAEVVAEVRGGGRSVPESRLRAGGFAAARGEGAQSPGADHAGPDPRADAGAGARQPEIRAGGIQSGITAVQTQHRSDRSRRKHDHCRARG